MYLNENKDIFFSTKLFSFLWKFENVRFAYILFEENERIIHDRNFYFNRRIYDYDFR